MRRCQGLTITDCTPIPSHWRVAAQHRSSRRRSTLIVEAAKTADGPSIAIVGVTGAVGQEFLRVRVGSAPDLQHYVAAWPGIHLLLFQRLGD